MNAAPPRHGEPAISPSTWFVFAVLVVVAGLVVFWWIESWGQRALIAQLRLENSQLRKQLDAAVEQPTPFQSAGFAPRSSQPNVDLTSLVKIIRSARSESDLDVIPFQDPGMAAAVSPLLAMAHQEAYAARALYVLRRIPQDRLDQRLVVDELIRLIRENRFSDELTTQAQNEHAYAFLVTLGDAALPATDELRSIMNHDHSPWSAHAAVTLKLLVPEQAIGGRLLSLLASPFATNRLIAARKLPDFDPPDGYVEQLREALQAEPSPEIRRSLQNSLERATTGRSGQ